MTISKWDMESKELESPPMRNYRKYRTLPIKPWLDRSPEEQNSLVKDIKVNIEEGEYFVLQSGINKCWYCSKELPLPKPLMLIRRHYPTDGWVVAFVCGYDCERETNRLLVEYLGPTI
jgi:hypothetical protein